MQASVHVEGDCAYCSCSFEHEQLNNSLSSLQVRTEILGVFRGWRNVWLNDELAKL